MSDSLNIKEIEGLAFFSSDIIPHEVECNSKYSEIIFFPYFYSLLRLNGQEDALRWVENCLGDKVLLGQFLTKLLSDKKLPTKMDFLAFVKKNALNDYEKKWIFLIYYESSMLSSQFDYSISKSILKDILILDPNFVPAVYYETIYERRLPDDLKQIERGLKVLSKYRRLDPAIILKEAEVSWFYKNEIGYEKLLRESLEVSETPEAYCALGIFYNNELDRPYLGIDYIKMALSIDTTFFEGYRELGWILYWQNEKEDGLENFYSGLKQSEFFLVDIFQYYYLEKDITKLEDTYSLIITELAEHKHIGDAVEIALLHLNSPHSKEISQRIADFEENYSHEKLDWLNDFLFRLDIW